MTIEDKSTDTFRITRDTDASGVVVMTMYRPKAMNSFNVAQFFSMLDAFEAVAEDKSVRAIVITGEGRAFCAGADISQGFASSAFGDGSGARQVETVDGLPRDTGGQLCLAISKVNVPIIAAMNGAAVGVGLTMTLPCDIRIASDASKYAFPFTRRGIVFDGAASFFLPKLVGHSKAAQWSLTGSYIDPKDGLRAGLFAELHAPADVLPRALELARDMAQNCSPESVAQNKRLLRAVMLGEGGPFEAHMRESRLLERMFHDHDCTEGVQAFLEKRTPKFEDRKLS